MSITTKNVQVLKDSRAINDRESHWIVTWAVLCTTLIHIVKKLLTYAALV